ncbi:MAG: D-alanyl-D-alanine carboxypeptidase family protein [Gammaproteobacteria bacterium]
MSLSRNTVVFCLAAAFGTAAVAADGPSTLPPKVDFNTYYLVDFATDTVLASNAADERLPPASLTKLMTAYVVFGALKRGQIKIADQAPVSVKAWHQSGTRMFIEPNSHVAVEDLVRGMLIQSGNDASVALAEFVGGSVDGFVVQMNAAAKRLSMNNSQWRNPHGLPAKDHYTTAHDLAILARAIISEFPDYYRLYSEREFSYNGITQQNRNQLLWRDPSVDGMKTGHTSAAGYCLVSSAEREGMRLIAVVLGAQSPRQRNDGAKKLLDYGFANYETRKLYSAGQQIEAAPVIGGDAEFAGVGTAADIFVTIPRGGFSLLQASMDRLQDLAAPLVPGATVGSVNVSFGGHQLASAPLVVLTGVSEGGVWSRLKSALK